MKIKDNQYKYSDEFGSYTVCFGNRTIEVRFIGFLSESLIEKYCDDLMLMLSVIEWDTWGYYGDLTKCDDAFTCTQDILISLHQRFLEHGCIVEAYTINSPKIVENIVKLRSAAGIEYSSLDRNLFSDQLQANNFIQSVLLKVDKDQQV